MNDVNLTQIILVIVPGVIILLANYLMFNFFGKREDSLRSAELAIKNRDIALPIRLQAYERLTLLMERLSPPSLLLRVSSSDLLAKEYLLMLITTIRSEYEHNLSQQLYVSANVWNSVTMVKDQLIKTINIICAGLPADASATDLSRAILNFYMDAEQTPLNKTALNLIHSEVKELF